MNLAPVCLFVYNRLDETQQTIHALQENYLAKESNLIIFSDGPKNEADVKNIKKIRSYLGDVTGFKNILIFKSKENKGLSESIVSGISKVVKMYGKVIVLEDDILTSVGFLKYMNDALNYYTNKEDVLQVSSFMFPINSENLPDTFFYQANTCWGWGTWERSWINFTDDSHLLLEKLKTSKIDWTNFNSMQGRQFEKQLLANAKGKLKTWAVKWHAVIKLKNGKVLHPKTSFVLNIGFSGNGENCSKGESLGSINNDLKLNVSDAENLNNDLAINRLRDYFKKRYSFPQKVIRKIKSYFYGIFT